MGDSRVQYPHIAAPGRFDISRPFFFDSIGARPSRIANVGIGTKVNRAERRRLAAVRLRDVLFGDNATREVGFDRYAFNGTRLYAIGA